MVGRQLYTLKVWVRFPVPPIPEIFDDKIWKLHNKEIFLSTDSGFDSLTFQNDGKYKVNCYKGRKFS